MIPVENAIHDAGLTKSQIDMVLLVGGSTRIPAVQDKVRTLMGKEPSRNVNPDDVWQSVRQSRQESWADSLWRGLRLLR